MPFCQLMYLNSQSAKTPKIPLTRINDVWMPSHSKGVSTTSKMLVKALLREFMRAGCRQVRGVLVRRGQLM